VNEIIDRHYETEYPNYRAEEKNREVVYTSSDKPVKHQIIPMCGHKFIAKTEPRHKNCGPCWFTFFQVHGEFTQAVEELYQKDVNILKKLKGPKFVDNFRKFMSTVAAFKESIEAAKEKDVSSIGSTEGSNEQGETGNIPRSTRSIREGGEGAGEGETGGE
jgi:hypothetical protein